MSSDANYWRCWLKASVAINMAICIPNADKCLLKLGKVLKDVCNERNATCRELQCDWLK
jgi:hypothetical protein